MSSYKKMYLVNEDKIHQDKNASNSRPYDIVMSPYLKSANVLDNDIKNILESKIEDNEKVKLYTSALQKYLIHRYKYLEPKQELKSDFIDLDIPDKIITKSKSKKLKNPRIKRKKMKKRISYSISKTPIFSTPIAKTPVSTRITKHFNVTPLTSRASSTPIRAKRTRGASNIASKRIKNIIQDEEAIPEWEEY